jgi:hypothetical protein
LPGTIAGELLLLAGCCLPAADATGYAGCCYAGCSALLLFDKVSSLPLSTRKKIRRATIPLFYLF